jgi:uncharacterized membrane protein
MTWKFAKTISLLIIIGLGALSLWARSVLPEASIATHFDVYRNPNGFMPRDTALMFGPGLVMLITLIFWALPHMMPKSMRIERSHLAYEVCWILTVLAIALAHVFIIGIALNWRLEIRHLFLAHAIMFIILGNYIPKMRYNPTLGIRTPWTLADERVWDKTHRFSGPVLMFGGILAALGIAFTPSEALWMPLFLTPLLLAIFVSIASSYVFSRELGRTPSTKDSSEN